MQEHQHRGSEFRGSDHRGRGRGRSGEHRGGGSGREGRWGGPRMRRGDIRTAILAVLTEGPGHGYDVMQNLEEKTGGAWRPSPGSVYPTLQLLEDEGLVRSTERDGKRVFEITDTGRAESAERIEQAGGTPWELAGKGPKRNREVRDAFAQLFRAFKQIAEVGSPEQVEKAIGLVNDTRKQLYQILAGE
jgi:DNA-binding PadR family transcriptional regulator